MGTLKRPRSIRGGLAVLLIVVTSSGLMLQLVKSRGPDPDGLPVPAVMGKVVEEVEEFFAGREREARTEGPPPTDSREEPVRYDGPNPAQPVAPTRFWYGDGRALVSLTPRGALVLGSGRGSGLVADNGAPVAPGGSGGAEPPVQETPSAKPDANGNSPLPATGSGASKVPVEEQPKPSANASRPPKANDSQGRGNAYGHDKKAQPSAKPKPATNDQPPQQAAAVQKTAPSQAADKKSAPPAAGVPTVKAGSQTQGAPYVKASAAAKKSAPKKKGAPAVPAGPAKKASNDLPTAAPNNKINAAPEEQQKRPETTQPAEKGKAAGRKG